jgi:hypothetical protein
MAGAVRGVVGDAGAFHAVGLAAELADLPDRFGRAQKIRQRVG